MTLLDELTHSLFSDAPLYMDFLYRYNPKKKQVFAFYEGDEDASFYHRFLEKSITTDCELEEIVAGCKNNVLKLQKEFDRSEYDKKQIAFFVDLDLSFWLNKPVYFADNIFVTEEYSVENYVVNAMCFKSWLTGFKGFARATKQEIEYMVKIFKELKIVFTESIKPVMAKAVIAKQLNQSIVLNKYKIATHLSFAIQERNITCNISEDIKLLEKWGIDSIDASVIASQMETFDKNKSFYSVRGKWLLYFMAELGEFMRLHADVFAPSLSIKDGKIPPTCSVPSSQSLTVLAPLCGTQAPKKLSDFLDSTYCLYCKRHSNYI